MPQNEASDDVALNAPDSAALLRLQRDLAAELCASTQMDDALERILDAAMEIPPIELGGIYLVSEDVNRVDLLVHKNLSHEFVNRVRTFHRGSPQLDVVLSGATSIQPKLAPDGSLGSACLDEGIRLLIAIPVVYLGQPVACLNVGSRRCDQIAPAARDALESLAGWVGGVIARIRAEQSRIQTEHRLRTLFAHLPDFVVETDPSGCIISANRGIGEFSADELRGRAGIEFLAQESVAPARRTFRQAVATGDSRLIEVRDRFGEYWLSRIIPQITGGRVSGAIIVNTNTTLLKRHAAALGEHRDTLRRLIRQQERDCRTLALNIHNQLAQQVIAVAMLLDRCLASHAPAPEEIRAMLERCRHLLDEMLPALRHLIAGVRPLILDELGLAAAIDFLIHEQRSADVPKIVFNPDLQRRRFPAEVEDAAFRIVEELFRNAVHHSHSPEIVIELVEKDDALSLAVEDFGRGFDPQQVPGECLGLWRVRAIARLFDAELVIRSSPGRGTRVSTTIPLN